MSATRREFVRSVGVGGAALLVEVPLFAPAGKAAGAQFAPNPWVSIDAAGKITLVVGHSEMGQGVRTSLAMILAEELEADWKTVAIRQASPSPEYKGLSTGGSDSVEDSWMPLRKAGAAARAMLLEAAAQTWKVPAAECSARGGEILHESTGRRLSYGKLVPLAATLPVPAEPALKDRRDFRLVGTRVPRLDGPAIVSGKAVYGLDVRLPGMLFAAVARCPVPGGKVTRFDAAKAKAVPDVVGVYAISTGVAVVARNSHAAFSGRDALGVVYDEGVNANLTTAELDRRLDDPAASSSKHALHKTRTQGNPAAALAAAATRLEATYRDAFQAHASVETQNCTAKVAGGACEIWAPTQHPERVQKECAELLKIAPEKVTVHVTLLGGGFGRRLGADYAVEAVEVARAAGPKHPVQVVWSRQDDFLGDYFHPSERVDLAAGLDASGKLTAWTHRSTCWHLSMFGDFDPADSPTDVSPWGGYDNPYTIENLSAEYTEVESPVRTGAWRAVYYPPNVFARESFLDEIAARGGRDPLELRLALLQGEPILTLPNGRWKIDRPRLAAVVKLAAEKSGWGSRVEAPDGRRAGRGIACNVYHARTVIAQVAEVSVGPSGDVRVHRVVTAVDCGQVVNRLGVEGQVESGVAWALSYALKGEITFRAGRAVQANYRDFPVMALAEMPAVETHVVDSDRPPTGLGEQPVPAIAPAVANAIFAATGKRVRRVPIRSGDLA
jgi:isoquinoline 1-oxidoreductase beta subunit